MSAWPMFFDYLDSPLGRLLLAADAHGLTHVDLPHEQAPTTPQAHWTRDRARLTETRRQLTAYFAGEQIEFTLPLHPQGTAFQHAVWTALRAIPYAETRSYGELARRIDRPRAVRAVGAANGANPLAIVVPCHRVIGADGRLTGYGGGLPAKHWLLAHERRHATLPPLQLTP
ncbi:MAG TPA: methylated-DNA--[protein]-cysteine S-methyltransferase [Rhodanobacteraceae bacterium]|nr:methylated-DNA--[protein]-cysteine S-methyltransferase [Rhodanobacteraceae bacterium]